ncbi:alginate O-acetylation protein [Spirochaetia bacterium]|nr:alginate O-acetylation protein [Spirochaetia bacterium]
MLFSSIPFIILFLPVTLLLYYCCPFLKIKNIILLFASLLFYAWGEPKFVPVMLFSIIINYGTGLLIGNPSFLIPRKIFLAIGISLNLLLLVYFKYLGFGGQILNGLIRTFHISKYQFNIFKIVLPLGISFYTFQSLSYLIDVYRNPSLVQRNILNLGLFISFFPQLIAGPIVRYHDINEQIKSRKHSLDLFARGIERFIVGLAKKVLIANTLAEIVDGILLIPYSSVPSVYLILVAVSGALQVYYDFSGYSDMAIGLGRMFGFRIKENFDYPFISTSFREFWKRWHISLSSWFQDYLYIPLGGSRKGPVRQAVNVLIVFTFVGLWHGAEYNFVLYGVINGVLLIIGVPLFAAVNRLFAKENKGTSILKSIVIHIFGIVMIIFTFMFFRLDLKNCFAFYGNLINFRRNVPVPLDALFLTDTRFYIFFAAAIAFSFPWWRKLRIPENMVTVSIRCALLLGLFVLSFGTLTSDAYNPFIYFRF